MTQDKVAAYLKDNVDWDRFFSVVDAVGNTLNGAKDRFDKSDIFELALDVYSKSNIEYRNEEGRDHFIRALGTYLEMKYDSKCLFTPQRLRPQKKVSLTLVNTMGNGHLVALPDGYADFVLAVGANGCAVISKSIIVGNLRKTSDQLKATIPFERFSLVKRPAEISRFPVQVPFPYKERKVELQKQFLASCVRESDTRAEH